MKSKLKFLAGLALVVCVAGPAVATGGHDHTPQNGGVVRETKAGDLELVAKPEQITLFVSDHDKPVVLAAAKAKVLLLNGAEKSEVELLPAGDKLQAKGSFSVRPGTKAVVLLTLAGKSAVSARFELK